MSRRIVACALTLALLSSSVSVAGIAQEHPGDQGLAQDPRVLLFEDFESEQWRAHWSDGTEKYDLVQVEGGLAGLALQAPCVGGTNGAMDFRKRLPGQPVDLYARYYVWFELDFETVDVGKFPGFAGTFGECGWGGRPPAQGDRCWSARGDLGRTTLDGKIPMGTYLYSQEMTSPWGEHDHWDHEGSKHLLPTAQWICIETHVRVERGGGALLEGWIDGERAYRRTVQLAGADTYIETFWMNLYHGGGKAWPQHQVMRFDQVVVATEYIGPMVARKEPSADRN